MFTLASPRGTLGLSGWRDKAGIWPMAQTVGEIVPPLILTPIRNLSAPFAVTDNLGKPAFGEPRQAYLL